MKRLVTILCVALLSTSTISFAQKSPTKRAQGKYALEKHFPKDGSYFYASYANDPLGTRIYKLKNGMLVYMSVNKNEPRIQTYIAVRAGSKNDPKTTTGLAHYLEHLLFKGTDKFGSLDYAKESVELDKIKSLYETYRGTTDPAVRTTIYHKIDSISGVAATFAIPNEYDKMMGSLGAKGTNAYTSDEQTVYVEDIPSNQLSKWITIEAERFRHPVFRLFHTELEAVYEEKNRTLDDDSRQANEALLAALFEKHPYGTQTTIGTVEHLKNPSIVEIQKFFDTYYVPNNMAICMAGDFDPDAAIKMIDQSFGQRASKAIPMWNSPVEPPITSPRVREVFGPDAESVQLAFRFPGVGSHDADVLTMVDMILANSKAGLIDLNLNQAQKVLSAFSGPDENTDYSVHYLGGEPLAGQSLEQVRDLVLSQIELVKQGKFDDNLLKAIINDLKTQQIRQYETNAGRANAFVAAFTTHRDWSDFISRLDRLSKITKSEIIDFAKRNYGNNYAIVYKRSGERKNVAKVVKPAITPVQLNRDVESPFMAQVLAMPTESVKPQWVDYQKDIIHGKLTTGVPVNYLRNSENDLFSLYYVLDMGSRQDQKMAFAVNYLPFLGTSTMSAEDLARKFYDIGCTFDVSASNDQIFVTLTGLAENFNEGVALFENLLANAKPDDKALQSLVERTIKSRADARKNKNAILSALRSYAAYGEYNPVRDKLSIEQLRSLTPKELVDKIHSLTSYDHHILYYGPTQLSTVTAELSRSHRTPAALRPVPEVKDYTFQSVKSTKVYLVDHDMAQAEVVMIEPGKIYDPKSQPVMSLYNEYFGGGMSSVVFQTIRESKALAYSVWSSMINPPKAGKPRFNFSYVGTQADKLPETLSGMFELLNNMPQSDKIFEQAKDAIRNKIETERITRTGILFSYETAKKMGLTYDIRKDIYEQIPAMTFKTIADYQKQEIANKPNVIVVLGSKGKLDMATLEKYGPVQQLTLDQVFGD